MADTYRSPYIAECVFAAAIYMNFQQKPTEAYEEVVHEEDDIEAVAEGKMWNNSIVSWENVFYLFQDLFVHQKLQQQSISISNRGIEDTAIRSATQLLVRLRTMEDII